MPTMENGLSYVGYSLNDGTTWQTLGAYAATLRITGGELNTGEWKHFDSDHPDIVPGKFNSHQIQTRLLYTHGTSEPYAILRNEFLSKRPVTWRWSYNSATTNYFKAKGYLTSVPVPDADANSADPIAVEVVQRVGQIEWEGGS